MTISLASFPVPSTELFIAGNSALCGFDPMPGLMLGTDEPLLAYAKLAGGAVGSMSPASISIRKSPTSRAFSPPSLKTGTTRLVAFFTSLQASMTLEHVLRVEIS